MNTPMIDKFEGYCRDVLGLQVQTRRWEQGGTLPLFLREAFEFSEATLLGHSFLLAADKREEEIPPAAILKQLNQIKERWRHTVVYLRERITSHNRRRLIEQNIPFVVPGTQLFLPMLGMDLRERFEKVHAARSVMSPSAQLLLLHVFHAHAYGPLTPGAMAQTLEYTPMTMTRAFAELKHLGIGNHVVRKKDRRLSFALTGRELWNQVSPLMRSPVNKTVFVEESPSLRTFPMAGLTALASHSMIAQPVIPTVACEAPTWRTLRTRVRIVPVADRDTIQLQVWNYSPGRFASKGAVDRLSLYLSLQQDSDERVQAARAEMLERIPW